MTKRFFCALLCLLMLIASLPASAMATDSAYGASETANALNAIRDDKDFAGLYLSDNQTRLVVMLVNASSARKNQIRAMVENPGILTFKNAKYTFAELQKICDEAIVLSGKGFDFTMCGVDEEYNRADIYVYYGGEQAARAYFAKYKDRVRIIGSDYVPMGDEYDPIQISNEKWIREVFPDAKEFSTEKTRFVFSGAPRATKTRAVLSEKGESLTLYRFDNKKDYQKAKSMIRGTTLVSGSAVVYVDTQFASTYFYNDASNMLALYCGSAQQVYARLYGRNFYPAGGLGGFFSRRNSAIYKIPAQRIDPNEKTPASPTELRAASSTVLTGIVKSVPTTKDAPGVYTIAVDESIRGALKGTISVTAMPGVLEKGRSYVLFLKKDSKGVYKLTDEAYFSAFELNDKGYVLPIREYGMTKPVTLATFKKSL
ncbi:MAG: hypothetical protein AAGU77_01400 [Bacillota bacterium]